MRIVSNTKLIQRNRKIGQYLTIGALVVLGVGLYISFRPEYLQFSLLALIIGFLVSQIGIYFGNRWGRSPRPDEILNSALKGLEDRYTLYHYTAPVSHLLVGPAGIWILMPYNQRGQISFSKDRWRQKGGGIGLAYLKIFAQESLGRPDLEVKAESNDLQKWLNQQFGEGQAPPFNTALVFTNSKVELQPSEESPVPAMAIDKLKDFIRKRVKENRDMQPETLKIVTSALPEPEESV